jgi:geranylgeranyl diphosphate synthase type I
MIRYHFGLDDPDRRRGKRVRPRILLDVAQQEGAPDDLAYDAAIAIELLHNYSLVHDDIEDRDELRHGRQTVWSKFGIANGIIVGNAMCALSYLSLHTHAETASPDTLIALEHALQTANAAMCAGQGRDISFETATDVTYDEFVAMIRGKTSALFGASCEMGALAAGVSGERALAYGEFGRAYGLAFQVRDDILGTWGTTAETGKPSGADIARRKWSFPVVWALAGPPSAARDVVARHYERVQPLDAAAVRDVVAALESLGAREAADAACDAYVADAARTAEEFALDPAGTVREIFTTSSRRNA